MLQENHSYPIHSDLINTGMLTPLSINNEGVKPNAGGSGGGGTGGTEAVPTNSTLTNAEGSKSSSVVN